MTVDPRLLASCLALGLSFACGPGVAVPPLDEELPPPGEYETDAGDLAAAPALLGHLAYSRDFEREADSDAIALLQANGIPPAVMAKMFERLRAHQRKEGMPDLPIALGSHPPDDERIARFRDAAAVR